MKKIIPFKNQLTFKTNVYEITSISLENTLQCKNKNIIGDLIITGTYKITESSINVDNFEFKIPATIEIDEKYNLENIIIDINDFYYEIINNSILEVNIEVSLDNIIEISKKIEPIIVKEEPPKIEPVAIREERPKIIEQKTETLERCIEEETPNIIENIIKTTDEYTTYHVYIIRENDTIESITSKYNISKEKLSEYNEINEIKLGDKIIIPSDAGNQWNIKKIWPKTQKIY